MNSRERVLLAINHQEPDRLPVFKPNIIQTYEPFSEETQRFLDTFEFDRFQGIGGIRANPAKKEKRDDGLLEDGYGCRYQYKGVGLPYCVHSPLANATTVDDVERFAWPEIDATHLVAPDARERARAIRAQDDYATNVGVGMLLHQCQYLRGFDQSMIDIKADPDLLKAILDHVYRINSTLAMALLEEVGDYVDIVSTGDDFGTSLASYMSVDDFRTHIKPYCKDLFGRIRQRFPHIKFYLHSHGQIMDLIPDLIDCGVDILNPILPLDNMDPRRLKRQFGDRLAFQGGVDIEHIMVFGSVQDVEKHVKDVIDVLAPGGGFLFKAQAISPLIPYENVKRAYDLAVGYGSYDK